MKRRALLSVSSAAALLMAGCAQDPAQSYLWGFGDPVRGAALNATRLLGNTARWDGDPAGAAIAAAQLEFLARSFRESPIWSVRANPATTQQLQKAVVQMRNAIGISLTASNAEVERRLRQASEALRAGSQARALAALSGPPFTLPAQEVLRRLGSLPQLDQVAIAAGMVNNEVLSGP